LGIVFTSKDWSIITPDIQSLEQNVDGNPASKCLHLMNAFITHMFVLLVQELERQSTSRFDCPIVLSLDGSQLFRMSQRIRAGGRVDRRFGINSKKEKS
jgi:hypothetical protein